MFVREEKFLEKFSAGDRNFVLRDALPSHLENLG